MRLGLYSSPVNGQHKDMVCKLNARARAQNTKKLSKRAEMVFSFFLLFSLY